MRALVVIALLAVTSGSAFAQSSDSATCRLFPLACPGPTPPKPEPLYGTPEEQAAQPAAAPVAKSKAQ